MDFEEFEGDYGDQLDDIQSAGYQMYAQKLRDWFHLLDTSEVSRNRIRQIEAQVDFNAWYSACQGTMRGMAGSGTLDWAQDRTQRLGQLVGLFRHLAADSYAFSDFCSTFLYSGNHFDDMIAALNRQIFDSFARDLLKDLRKFHAQGASTTDVPASDRIVALDHNSEPYHDTVQKLDELEEALRGSNELGDLDQGERERLVAEINAGNRLLRAARVRIGAIFAVLVSTLRWLGEKFAENTIGILVAAVIAVLAKLLGITIPTP